MEKGETTNQRVIIAERVSERHPELTNRDVLTAWGNRLACQMRTGPWPTQYVAVGFDDKGRAVEMVAVYDPFENEVLIFHANTPATKKILHELKLD